MGAGPASPWLGGRVGPGIHTEDNQERMMRYAALGDSSMQTGAGEKGAGPQGRRASPIWGLCFSRNESHGDAGSLGPFRLDPK